jgi:ABC-2 type transport system ATP-binding protein
MRGVPKAQREARVEHVARTCALRPVMGKLIRELSKGFRQRVGLAQALVHDPEVIVLDEPMSGLDPNQIIEIRQLIRKIGEEKTIVYCSHILPEVAATCSRLIIINEGQIVASGTPDELTARSSRGNRYIVRVQAPGTQVQNALGAVSGVTSVTLPSQSGDWVTAELISDAREDIGEAIFRCVVSKNWALAELRHETASLEEVFTQLTRS